jgi:hypothetical protein
MTRGFMTETFDGWGDEPHPEFADLYNAREVMSAKYAVRTEANARDTDATIWFGSTDTSRERATPGACRQLGRPCLCVVEGVTLPSGVADWIAGKGVKVLNVVGNRESKAPGIGARVERFLGEVFRQHGHGRAGKIEGDDRWPTGARSRIQGDSLKKLSQNLSGEQGVAA